MASLLADFRGEGFVLALPGGGDTLRVSPATRLTPVQRATLHAHKAALIEALRREAAEAAARRAALHDPRPDLAAAQRDDVWWSVLLALAAAVDDGDPRGAFGALHGVRCLGAGLVRMPGGGLRIVPGDIAAREWRAVRGTWLVPHRTAVADLLRAVAAAWRTHAEDLAVAPTLRAIRRI